jgi:ribosomal protein S18 acetylase RimI-like enzyme
MDLSLRPPIASDYEVIAHWLPDAAACLRWAGDRLAFPFLPHELADRLQIGDSQSVCLATGSAPPVAFAQFWTVTTGSVHLGRIIVSPSVRGQGVGAVLVRQLISAAIAATGAVRLTLRVYSDNQAAIELYRKFGFVTLDTQSNAQVLFMQADADAPIAFAKKT